MNNAAVAAQNLLDRGHQPVTVLDIDYHHGNGTQSIFYQRSNVAFISIHAHPENAFPYYSGFADEIGSGAGRRTNVNLPLAVGSGWDAYREALHRAMGRVGDFDPAALVISLGVDTAVSDPVGGFRLEPEHFVLIGELIGEPGLPALFVLEGGYDLDRVGPDVVSVLTGFDRKKCNTQS